MIEYRSVNFFDAKDLTEIYCDILNDGDVISKWIEEGLKMPGYCGIVAVENGRTIGVNSARPKLEFTCGHEDLVREISGLYSGNLLYADDMFVVLPEYRGRGIGKRLCAELFERLSEVGCNYLVVEEWIHLGDSDSQAGHVIKHIGERTSLGVFPDFYKNLSEYGLKCPVCGSVCNCGAEVSVVKIK